MTLSEFIKIPEDENPLDTIRPNGGFCGIFRTIGCIGDSLSSGEFESLDEEGNRGWHDMYEYSWGQYIARTAGCKVYNFSRGGMTAKWYWDSFADENDFWSEDKLCQAYIVALGVNDLINCGQEPGTTGDICMEDYNRNADTFAGYYARIIQRIKSMQPKARFFLMTMPQDDEIESDAEKRALADRHAELMHELADIFDYTYVLDLRRYAPVYDSEFHRRFFLSGHMNAAGYLLTAQMVMSGIDSIIRANMEDFSQVGFIGTPFHNAEAKW